MSSIGGPRLVVVNILVTFLKVLATVPDPMSRHSRSLGLIRLLDTCAPGVTLDDMFRLLAPASSGGWEATSRDMSSTSNSLSSSFSTTVCRSSLKCWKSRFRDSNISSQQPHLVPYAPAIDISGSSVLLARGSSVCTGSSVLRLDPRRSACTRLCACACICALSVSAFLLFLAVVSGPR